jgi:hypothetical protein
MAITTHRILTITRETVDGDAACSHTLFANRRRALAAADWVRAAIRAEGSKIGRRVERILVAELSRIAGLANALPTDATYFLAHEAEAHYAASLRFTGHDAIGCTYHRDWCEGERHEWFHNGVRVDLDRVLELLPSDHMGVTLPIESGRIPFHALA